MRLVLSRHVRAWVAPVALTGRSAERAHLNGVDRAWRQAFEGDVLRIAREKRSAANHRSAV